MAHHFQGQRVSLNLEDSDDEDFNTTLGTRGIPSNPAFDFAGEIKERAPSTPKAPVAPTLKSTATGFPAHKKRTRTSAFKQKRQQPHEPIKYTSKQPQNEGTVLPTADKAANWEENERRQIDQENNQKLASMSSEEIEQERQELFSSLDPSIIQALLRRANIDDNPQAAPKDSRQGEELGFKKQREADGLTQEQELSANELVAASKDSESTSKPKPPKKVAFQDAPSPPPERDDFEAAIQGPDEPAPELPPVVIDQQDLPTGSIHFPHAPSAPDLDPTSATFLTDLHKKYFPDLPHDAEKISWMTDAPTNPNEDYHPSRIAYEPNEIRFDFRGKIIPPSLAQEIPVTKGLHNHGASPDAAGYTVPELARLARSVNAGQRCIAIQTLGRILYRLGIGEFGDETKRGDAEWKSGRIVNDEGYDDGERDEEAELARGLWQCAEEGRVLETLEEEAGKEKGHLTSITLAKEALWNWQRGGGRRRRAV